MITLYKDQSKNDKLKAVIADLRSKIGASNGIPWSFKYFHPDGKVRWLMEKYDIKSKAMAKKILWIIMGDMTRQIEIYKALGKEYVYREVSESDLGGK